MASYNDEVVLNFKMNGQVQYAQTIKEINSVMNTAAKEYKNHIAAMGNDASATDKLRAEKKKLEIQMEGAQKRTKMLRDEYEAMAKDTNATTEQLTKMYGKLLDSENAEAKLQKSLERVNGGLSEQAQEAREATDQLNDLKGESKLLEAEQKSLTSAFKLQNSELDENASEAERTELAQKQLKQQMELTGRTVSNLEKQLSATKKVYGENSFEVKQMEAKLNDAKSTIGQFTKKLDTIKSSSKDAGDGMEKLGKKMDLNNMMEATEMLQGVSDQLIEIGKAAMESGLQFGDSQTNIQANLGLTGEEAEKLNKVVNDVFKNGVVESMDEASQAVILVKQNFKKLDDVQLEKLTNQITTISKRTGTDVKDNVIAASRLMNEFGLTGTQAMDLIATGYQNNLNMSDDFLDALTEYAPHFESAGFKADEMMQIIKNGMENGALNTDKAADAVKEFQIKLGDGSYEKIIKGYSKETQNMFKKWQDGKVTTADVATSISKDLKKMSPNEQQVALSQLASQFEDLGIDGAAALFNVGDAFKDTAGKADEMSKKSPGEEWQASLRELQDSIRPIGETIIESLTPVVEKLAEMGKWFSDLPEPIKLFVIAFTSISIAAGILIPIIAGLAFAFGALNISLAPIIAIIAGVAAVITGIILVIKNWGDIWDWLEEKTSQFVGWMKKNIPKFAESFVKWFNEMKEKAVNKFTEMKDKATDKVEELKNKASGTIKAFKDNTIQRATELKDKFIGKVNELKDGAVNKYNDLKNKVTSTIQSLKTNAVNKASELKTSFVNKVNDLIEGAISKFNSLRDSAGRVMTQAKEKILAPIELAKKTVKKIVGEIKGFFSNLKLKIPTPSLPKLPRFSLETGSKTIMGKTISYPTGFDIDWRAKGAIFTQPTIFGMQGGRLQGAGDAGPEAALPLNAETLGMIGEGIVANMKGMSGNVDITLQIDGRTLARVATPYIDQELGRKKNPWGR